MVLDPAALPDDVAALKAMLIAADKRAVVAEARAHDLDAEIETLSKHPAKAAGGLGRVAVGRCGQAACWAVWLSRAVFQFQGSRASIWCRG